MYRGASASSPSAARSRRTPEFRLVSKSTTVFGHSRAMSCSRVTTSPGRLNNSSRIWNGRSCRRTRLPSRASSPESRCSVHPSKLIAAALFMGSRTGGYEQAAACHKHFRPVPVPFHGVLLARARGFVPPARICRFTQPEDAAMFRVLLIAAVASTLLGSNCHASDDVTAKSPMNAEEAELRKYLLETIDRFNKHEIRPASSPGFTLDADFVNVEGRWMRGLEEIRRAHTAASKGWLKDANIKLIELKIRFIRPDVAIVHQLHEMTGLRHPDGTLLPLHQEISTRVLVKEPGEWITTAFQNMIVDSRPAR